MAKAKKRVAVRKKSSKRGKASTKPARKMTTKHPTPKKTKSKAQRAGMSTKKSPAKKKRPPETMVRKPVAEAPVTTVETTIIDVIEEPAPGVVAVTEYQSVQTATSIPAGSEPERCEGIGLAGVSPMVSDQGNRPEHGAEEQRDALME
jgi:hypothetical protein